MYLSALSLKVKHMRIIYEMTEQNYKRIGDLIRRGQYTALQDFFDVSITNQLYLEEQALDRSHPGKTAPKSAARDQIETVKEFKEFGRNWGKLLTVEPVPVESLGTQFMPFSNRIFPAKVAARVLCNTLGENQTVDYGVYAEVVSHVAVGLGTYLKSIDRKQGRSFRLEALSTGLPAAKRGDQKIAVRRFLEHVVGGSRHAGEHHGMLFTLGLVGMPREGQMGITADGLQFAELVNPVLDRPESEYGELKSCLAREEADFYVTLVKKRLPEEARTVEIIREIVRSKHSYPEICAEFTRTISLTREQANVEQRVSTELARMRELGLVLSRAEGLKTYYDIPAQ